MYSQTVKKSVGRLASISLVTVVIFVTPMFSLDPINVGKMWVLSTFAFGCLFLIASNYKGLLAKANHRLILASAGFVVSMAISATFSEAPLEQQIFGVYGRNTGFLTYFSLTVLLISVAVATGPRFAKQLNTAILVALTVNVIYAFYQSFGKEFLTWQSAYSPIIGTLGNPNFLSAFLGMGIAYCFPYLLAKNTNIYLRLSFCLLIAISIYTIVKSDSIQGLLVAAIGISISTFFWLKYFFQSKLILTIYSVGISVLSILGALGIFGLGPLKKFIYSSTIVNRIDYWTAGIEMIKQKPIFGVGLDSYGDWYRATRSLEATQRSGPSTVTNSAHNVFIDIASTSGLITITLYFFIIIIALLSVIKILKVNPHFDPFLFAILATWIAYLIQSLISINNIGLAIFGWVLPGALIAYERWLSEIDKKSEIINSARANGSKISDFSSMFAAMGLFIGGVVGFIPFNADANFRHSLQVGNAEQLKMAAFQFPKTSSRLTMATNIFTQNADKVPELEREVASASIKFNPLNFDSWRVMYEAKSSTADQKAFALEMMKKLDPYNQEILKPLG